MANDLTREAVQRRAELLAELLAGEAWQEIVVPVLKARQADLLRRLATTTDNVADLRFDQGQWRLLEQIVTDGKAFFRERG